MAASVTLSTGRDFIILKGLKTLTINPLEDKDGMWRKTPEEVRLRIDQIVAVDRCQVLTQPIYYLEIHLSNGRLYTVEGDAADQVLRLIDTRK